MLRLLKGFLYLFLLLLFFQLNSKSVLADGEFYVDANVHYVFNENGSTKITHSINLENAYATMYAKKYTLTLENLTPLNIEVKDKNKPLNFSETKENDSTKIEVFLDDPVIGKGQKNNFNISFDVNDLSNRTGKVWELLIPKLSGGKIFRNYEVVLDIPNSFGDKAYISPKPYFEKQENSRRLYYFKKDSLVKTGITAGFGNFQIFSFSINYHLENPLNRTANTTITLPPDTAFQKVYYENINPRPKKIELDIDGNWIATYELSARERVDIKTIGSVQIFSSKITFLQPSINSLQQNLTSNKYWQSDDPEIKKIAKELKTPQRIYNFVVKTLNYDYKRVKPNVKRLGAKDALSNPNSAICMEFTDLFIALSRAAGIPAREVDGYAYTKNPDIQPLSLVADVLHSWPEYWDEKQSVWVPIDPTWGNTTGGVDYFNKLDLRHFVFVIHGKDVDRPHAPGSYKLGSNPQKDVFVNFSKLPEVRKSDLQIDAELTKKTGLLGSKLSVEIYNPGPTAVYNLEPEIDFDREKVFSKEYKVILPYSKKVFEVNVPFSFLGRKTASNISIIVASKIKTIRGNKIADTIISIIVLLLILFISSLIILKKYQKIKISQIFAKLKRGKKPEGK